MNIEREVTILLKDYNELFENNIRYKDILKEFKKIIDNTERLNWNSKELNITDELNPIIRKLLPYEYNARLLKLKKEEEQQLEETK